MVHVELVYINAKQEVIQFSLTLEAGATVADAIAASAIYDLYPETQGMPVGIYTKIVSLDTLLHEQDRIEIYRPLALDPKEKRRLLAAKK